LQGSDLALATRIAAALVGSFGHVGSHCSWPTIIKPTPSWTTYMRTAAHQELSAAFDEAKRILEMNREALKEVANRLRARGLIDGHEVEATIGSSFKTSLQSLLAGKRKRIRGLLKAARIDGRLLPDFLADHIAAFTADPDRDRDLPIYRDLE
jgi:hypothetical protein